ncbi:MAG: GNAT family N-acetyltransferase [Alphaproteobacteria bacterium]|nr:GNAT family N-acetyltransferase [Alphaproteobacteria bacterium]
MIRAMTPDDLGQAVAWAAREGWNPGLSDAPAFLAQDAEAFLMAERDGTMAACISVTKYGEGFGFLGFYIAAPEARGQGLGMAVWQAGMVRLAGRVVGLDGVVAQQDNYRKSGFHFAWNNARYVALAPRVAPPDAMLPRAHSVPFGALIAYDAACFGAPRPAFLRAWIDTPGHVALVLPGLRGFGVVRPARHGSKIGPLFADDAAGARRLFAALVAAAPPGPITLDVPEDHEAAVAIAREAGMDKVFETARMYTAAPPPMARDRLFGVTSFELG